jgi:hypothetical protein
LRSKAALFFPLTVSAFTSQAYSQALGLLTAQGTTQPVQQRHPLSQPALSEHQAQEELVVQQQAQQAAQLTQGSAVQAVLVELLAQQVERADLSQYQSQQQAEWKLSTLGDKHQLLVT